MGQRIDFLKLLFDGHALTLPIKGSQVQKSDNPVIVCAANHSLRDLFLRKYRFTCTCLALPQQTLCNRSPDCSVPEPIIISYNAMAARITEISVETALFPNVRDGGLLWAE